MLAGEAQRRRAQRGNLYLCEFKPDANRVLERGGYLDIIGRDHPFATQKEAIAEILPHVDTVRCQHCDKPVSGNAQWNRVVKIVDAESHTG